MPTPLNPALYGRLVEEFGFVQTSHSGIAAIISRQKGPFNNENRISLLTAGEYYRINCPYCGDSRGRLWINHLFGVADKLTGSRNLWLAICYNEDCLSIPGKSQELHEQIYGFRNVNLRGKPIVVIQGEVIPEELKKVDWPGKMCLLSELHAGHQAVKYLYSKNLDLSYLSSEFGVQYCYEANQEYPLAQDRLVIPIVMDELLVGWQCRYPDDIDWKTAHIPKYYNRPNMPRRLMLYNIDNAKKYPFTVITEGPSDVWRVGPYSIATFGKHLSVNQVSKISSVWENCVIFILLDGDAWEDAQKLAVRFGPQQDKVIPIKLPEDKDPGGMTCEEIKTYIDNAASARGINLSELIRTENHAYSIGSNAYRCHRPKSGPTGPIAVDS